MAKVMVVTGTRAEYGLLRPVILKLMESRELELQLVVTGAHLSEAHGMTVEEIEADGVPIAAELDILSQPVPEGRAGTAWRTALAMEGFLEACEALQPDVMLVLGDRYEILAAAEATALLGVPVAHISGGDVTSGADDDWFRHAITKLAKLHFPSCDAYAARLLRMGEQPGAVHMVGGLGDENIRSLGLMDVEALGESLGLELSRPFALVTLHPETATGVSAEEQAKALCMAMEAVPGLFYLITGSNADAGGDVIDRELGAFCEAHENAAFFQSLGLIRYLSAMRGAAVVLGNSSSGVVETPSFGVPAVDIGQRQAGRLRAVNVLHTEMDAAAIEAAIQKALTPEFDKQARAAESPYDGGDTSGRIVEILAEALADGRLQVPKVFYDGES